MSAEHSEADPRFLPGFGTGLVPGAAVYTGVDRDFDIRIHVFDWTKTEITELQDASLEEAAAVRGRDTVSWVNVSGIHDAELIRELGQRFDLHALSVEDILNPRHRPKVEHYPDYVYLVLKMAYAGEDGSTKLEQISLVLGLDYVLTFQEEARDVFDDVRVRLRDATGRIRNRGHDYLAYALMDAVVDNYVIILEGVGSRMDEAETTMSTGDPDQVRGLPATLHEEKRDLMALRKAVLPLREAISVLNRNESRRIDEHNLPYLRDLQDHLVQLLDSIDIYREMIASLLNLHLALVGQRTNEEMRVLTVIATIFIPLTFIVGVYGMNFDNMPELHASWAYPALWVLMLGVASGLLLYFRRRRWL